MPQLTQLTSATRTGGINRDPCSRGEPVTCTVVGTRPGRLHNTCELVTEYRRTIDGGLSDPSVEIGVEVRSTNPDGSNADPHLSRAGICWRRRLLDPEVLWAMENGGTAGGRSETCHHGMIRRALDRWAPTGRSRESIGRDATDN